MSADPESYYRDHWVDVSADRHAAYEEMFRWRPEMDVLLAGAELAAGQQVLDYGCGPGHLSIELARRVAPDGRVTALDINAEFVARAAARAREAGLGQRLKVRAFDGRRIPAGDASHDRVVCKSVLEYVDDPAEALAEFRRVVRRGGRAHVIDSDWRMLVVEPLGADAVAALFDAARPAYRTPEIGRRLPALFRAAGFRDIAVSVFAAPDLSGRRAAVAFNMMDYARTFGRMDAGRIDALEAEVRCAIADGTYMLILPQFVVSATA